MSASGGDGTDDVLTAGEGFALQHRYSGRRPKSVGGGASRDPYEKTLVDDDAGGGLGSGDPYGDTAYGAVAAVAPTNAYGAVAAVAPAHAYEEVALAAPAHAYEEVALAAPAHAYEEVALQPPNAALPRPNCEATPHVPAIDSLEGSPDAGPRYRSATTLCH
jgi:hypothetical protein